ncbi:MAG TPA: glycosyltransferase family 9 protein [Desulfosporosinus sp.]|nr:glycosyltransferase family 9 protein [Desulfosporosinus sp.]
MARTFDYAIGLDAGKVTAGMMTMAKASKKFGYILHEDGYVIATNEAADEWLRMGIFDNLKQANQRSHQEIMCSILGIAKDGMKYVLELTENEKEEGRRHLERLGISLDKRIIGIHTGGGERWTLKQWSEEKFVSLIPELAKQTGCEAQILLFGGPLERELNKRIQGRTNIPIFDAGCDNNARHFASLINNISVLLSGDSLAMHVALAMGRRVVVLFGPTSNTEIELFGLGEKVIPNLDCLACYKKTCDFTPNCMDAISVDMVKKAIFRQLAVVENHSIGTK